MKDINTNLDFEKLINPYFYTSNIEKFLQARVVFSRLGCIIRHYRGINEPYYEDYHLGTKALLARAVQQLAGSFGLRSAFFVEDTSMRLEALSTADEDYPGLRVKEWFSDVTFEELDQQLRLNGNDRRAVVKSDIALHLPKLQRPIFFHGETSGKVVEAPPKFEAPFQYPWLSPSNFNAWFLPEDKNRCLGQMEFEESWEFDFRIRAFLQLYLGLEELNAALNLPVFGYVRRHRLMSEETQLRLLPSDNPIFCVIGPKCAGKSTLGDYVSQSIDTTWHEASRVFQGILTDKGINTIDVNALKFLKKAGMDIVMQQILKILRTDGRSLPLITGLRTCEELLTLRKHVPNLVLVCIDADQKVRYERHIRRARDSDIRTFANFRKYDEDQSAFGLLRVAKEVSDVVIENNDSMREYHRRIDEVIGNFSDETFCTKERAARRKVLSENELVRSLMALSRLSKAATCKEISDESTKQRKPVRIYNTNRALKGVPEMAKRIKRGRELLRYRILESGKAYLEFLELHLNLDQV